ncbi:MAG: YeeE/YedE family protein [Candidatus Peribacteria bacterium]|nr:MAG: YeeE/YedE family protein [Candidatus Peribacteria bacterium]
MRKLVYVLLGAVFGVTLIKAEAVSWLRIQEMFHFQSFHMYGIILSAILINFALFRWIKQKGVRTSTGELMTLNTKISHRLIFPAGVIFGLGWALVGACPGPMYALLGYGYWSILIVLAGALLGTLLAGKVRELWT